MVWVIASIVKNTNTGIYQKWTAVLMYKVKEMDARDFHEVIIDQLHLSQIVYRPHFTAQVTGSADTTASYGSTKSKMFMSAQKKYA